MPPRISTLVPAPAGLEQGSFRMTSRADAHRALGYRLDLGFDFRSLGVEFLDVREGVWVACETV